MPAKVTTLSGINMQKLYKYTKVDSIITNIKGIDTTLAAKNTDSVKVKKTPKSDVETTIKYEAEDSLVMDAELKTAKMYNKSKVDYGTKNIVANTIMISYGENLMTAKFGEDSLGKKIGVPIFKDGKDQYEAEQMKYNYKTKKGQIKGVLTKQGDGIIHGQTVKKEPDNNMFVKGAKYSTCDYREPHFCIKATKIKLIPNKKLYTKAFNMQFDDIPTPLAFPFGIFPITKKRSSGIIMPSYGDNSQRGFMLLGGGFYWAVNKYIGAKITTDFYTIGGNLWNGQVDYKSRYSFQGNFQFSYNGSYTSKDNPQNQGKQQSFLLRWTHTTLSKGSGRFTASVNYQSSKFFTNTSYDPALRQQGQIQSNLSYSNEIKKTPFNYSLMGRMSQSVSTGVQDYTLPSASLNMRQIFPLRNVPVINKLEPVKKFNFRINTQFDNQVQNIITPYNPTKLDPNFIISNYGQEIRPQRSFYPNIRTDSTVLETYLRDSVNHAIKVISNPDIYSATSSGYYFKTDTITAGKTYDFFGSMLNNAKWNLSQNINFGTTIRVLKYFNLSPNISGTVKYYGKEYGFSDFDPSTNTAPRSTIENKFGATYSYSTGANITTRVYGTFYIKKLNIEAIRHTVIPSLGYSYTPDFSDQEVKRVRINANPDDVLANRYYNIFTGAITTAKTGTTQSNISFGLGNQLEMKLRDKKDTTKIAYKKLMLLDNVNFTGSYNLVADSFNLSNIGISARTRIYMFDINFTSTFDPYLYQKESDGKVRRRPYLIGSENRSEIDAKKTMISSGIFRNANLSIGTSFKPKTKGKKINHLQDGGDAYFNQRLLGPNYVDWSLPWSLNINYVMSFDRFSSGFDRTQYRNNFTLNGDLSLTPFWKLTASTAYDVNNNAMSTTRIAIARDLHCWQASITWFSLPSIGADGFFATIGIKSPTLRDLKFERRGQPF